MNIFADIKALILECLSALQDAGTLPDGLDFSQVAIEPPRDAFHGEMASNAAMVLAKAAKQKPRDIAQALAELLLKDARIEAADVAGPGFLNLRLKAAQWQRVIPVALRAGPDFGRTQIGARRKVSVEFMAGGGAQPLQVHHARGAVFGDALANLLEFMGFETTREIRAIDGGGFGDDFAKLGVSMDLATTQEMLMGNSGIDAAMADLKALGLIYNGTLEVAKGQAPEGWEPREQVLFRATDHGDEIDRPVQKSDGTWTGFARDIAYQHGRISRGFDELISVLDVGHVGNAKKMRALVAALSVRAIPLDVKLIQHVRLSKGGQDLLPLQAERGVLLRELLDEIDLDVLRFAMLARRSEAPLMLEVEKVLEQSKDNPAFAVQYAHANVCSILRRAEKVGLACDDASLASADMSLLSHAQELTLLRKVAEWPRLLGLAAQHHEPHRIALYLNELAQNFHGFQQLGQQNPALSFTVEGNPALCGARLALIRSVSVVISVGLGIIGVTPRQEM